MTQKNTQARKDYWAAMTPEEKTLRMRAIAIKKQKLLTFGERSALAKKMVAAKRKKRLERIALLQNKKTPVV